MGGLSLRLLFAPNPRSNRFGKKMILHNCPRPFVPVGRFLPHYPLTIATLHMQCFIRSFLLLVASLGVPGAFCAEEPLEAFLTKHCISCHGSEKEKKETENGDLRIDQLSRDFKSDLDTHHWAEVIERINSGEMPPESEPRPTQEEIAAFVTKLDSLLKEGRAARMAARPAVAHYRLSRKEYRNTVYDLLGVRYDPAKPGELNEDTLWHGFERIGSQLSLSPSHVDRYYRAAETVLDRAFPTTALDEARKATLREKIEAHRNDANCAACHAKIDPLGLAWDNYDAIGQWRTREKVPTGVGEDPLVDASGLMPDGRPFTNSVQFKKLLLEDRDKVTRAFSASSWFFVLCSWFLVPGSWFLVLCSWFFVPGSWFLVPCSPDDQ